MSSHNLYELPFMVMWSHACLLKASSVFVEASCINWIGVVMINWPKLPVWCYSLHFVDPNPGVVVVCKLQKLLQEVEPCCS